MVLSINPKQGFLFIHKIHFVASVALPLKFKESEMATDLHLNYMFFRSEFSYIVDVLAGCSTGSQIGIGISPQCMPKDERILKTPLSRCQMGSTFVVIILAYFGPSPVVCSGDNTFVVSFTGHTTEMLNI